MRQLLTVIAVIFLFKTGFSQKTEEIGVFFSGVSYFGDIKNQNMLKSISPAYGVYVRFALNPRLALTGQLSFGTVMSTGGTVSDVYIGQTDAGTNGNVAFPRVSGQSFSFKKPLSILEMLFEYNFQDYVFGNDKAAFSPYLAIGIGGLSTGFGENRSFLLDPHSAEPEDNPVYYPVFKGGVRSDKIKTLTAVIPIGMGVKWNVTERMAVNLSVIARKTFSDNIDNLDDPKSSLSLDTYETGFANSKFHNNDWVSTISFSISYLLNNGKGICKVKEKMLEGY